MDDLERHITLSLSSQDAMTLIGSVQRSLRYWQNHYAEDAGAAHSATEYAEVRRRYGELLWRLESAAVPQGAGIQHSEGAIRPKDEPDGGRRHSTAADAAVAYMDAPHPDWD